VVEAALAAGRTTPRGREVAPVSLRDVINTNARLSSLRRDRGHDLTTPEVRRRHMLEGKAIDADVSWHFRWQALTCDESHRVAPWLRLLAERVASPTKGPEAPARLAFTEPNLAFVALEVDADRALLRVELDLEFHRDRAHWQAGDPYLLDLVVTEATLMQAATQWEAEVRAYPGR
jgi:hypothetical protein